MAQADIGLIGLAVMGQNLVLNMNDHGFKVAVYNRTTAKIDEFLQGPAKNTAIQGTYSIPELVSVLKKPRIVMLMVKAGQVVDQFIEQLIPHLESGDVIIDGGNSLYTDTNRRTEELSQKGILFVGTGISGGEEGARFGPSIMPGGNPTAWTIVQPILQTIAAQVDNIPCCQWIGDKGAGHYVKMVHNGIEYGDMQLICEVYQLLREGLKLPSDTLQSIFREWNQGVLDSYLVEITGHILGVKDETGDLVLDTILDVAGQKGTGKWTGINALDLGTPLTLITEAVFARCLSALKDERMKAATLLKSNTPRKIFDGSLETAVEAMRDALYAAKIISHTQGFMLMRQAVKEYNWTFNSGVIAMIWRGGCIIRSKFLNNINHAFNHNPQLESLLLDDFFANEMKRAATGWRQTVVLGMELEIPIPALSSALAFYDGYRSEKLPANLLQAQRDYFGAHTYERVDKPRGQFFHTEWTQDEK